MQETCSSLINPQEEEKLKIAVENTCELCHEYHPSASLEIHPISRRCYKEMKRDPSTRILIVCHPCHIHIHHLPLPVGRQRMIVKGRSFFIRRDLRQVLGYTPKPYQAPDDINLYVIYEENMGRSSQDRTAWNGNNCHGTPNPVQGPNGGRGLPEYFEKSLSASNVNTFFLKGVFPYDHY